MLGRRKIYWDELKRAVAESDLRRRAARTGQSHARARPWSRLPTPRSSCTRDARSRSSASAISKSGSRHEHAQGEPDDRRRLRRPEAWATCRRRSLRSLPKLRLHRGAAASIDPVTFEVIRHELWNVNEEHGATIQRISGSPVAMYALDLNPSILTEDAEFVYFGPYMQYMSGVTDTQVKWVLEIPQRQPRHPRRRHVPRQRSLGRRRAPAGRHADLPRVLGGRAVLLGDQLPASIRYRRHHARQSFCGSAETAFEEGILIPPVKIVEGNQIRRDIEELYLRSSRKPEAGGARFSRPAGGQHQPPATGCWQLIRRYGAGSGQGRDEANHRQRAKPRSSKKLRASARRRLARPLLRRMLPPRRPPRVLRHADAAQEGRRGLSSRTRAPRRSTAR